MDLTRDYIDGLSFTVKKDKYYLGSEVDDALDYIAGGVDALNRSLADERAREEKMAKVIVKLQNTTKQQQADLQAMEDEKAQVDLDRAQYTDEIAHLNDIKAGFDADKAQLMQANAVLEADKAELQRANIRLESEKAELIQAKAQLEAEKARLIQANEELKAEKASLLQDKMLYDAEKTSLLSAKADLERRVSAPAPQHEVVTPQPVVPAVDPEKLRLAAKAERFLAEYRATRETLIAELTALQSKRDSLQESINAIAGEAAEKILAITKVEVIEDD